MGKMKAANRWKRLGWREMAAAVGLLLLVSAGVNLWQWRANRELAKDIGSRVVAQVLDGDTFVAEDNVIVRLVSVEAPEKEVCGGEKAKQVLTEMILGKRVRLEVQVRDSYGRLVALAYDGDKLVNEEILAGGWAFYTGANSPAKDRLMAAGEEARSAKRGIFGSECTQAVNPDKPECVIKGNYDASETKRSKRIYHFPGCGRYDDIGVELYRGDRWFCSEKEAEEAGFVKSGNCFGRKFGE
jgi:endonuclease YncB( thermonuclease family)